MKIRKNILFIIPTQYGYHTDSYKYCELLSEQYDVTYVGIDCNNIVRNSDNVKVFNLAHCRTALWRFVLFFFVAKLRREKKFDKVFIYSFPLCSIFLLLFKRKILIMDVRTSFIEGKIKSKILNLLLFVESHLFKHISVISWGVAEFLSLNKKKCFLLPLGGDSVPFYKRINENFSLLYVGTFYDRYIEKTVEGIYIFMQEHKNIRFEYTIIGIGSDDEIKKITDCISEYNLSDVVHFVGEKRHEELIPYFKSHNVGISYIPLTDYYDCQPPTKTFEYLLNAMVVIATPTTENCKVINSSNGILLHGDTEIEFAKGLELLFSKKNDFNFEDIYNNAQKYSWSNVVNNYLLPIIENIAK